MYATIMVPARGDGSDEAALNAAFTFAKPFGAHIDFVRVHEAVAPSIRDFSALLPQGNLGDAYVQFADEVDRRLTAAADASFERFCERNKPFYCADTESRGQVSVARAEASGATDAIIEARYYDVVVCADGPAGAASDLVMGCGRPVVLAPAKCPDSMTRTVAIAWKETAEAARAVSAAMPLLHKAEKVIVIAANEADGGASQTTRSADRLVRQLKWHGIPAEPHAILSRTPSAADAVLDAARDAGANILVMGAYGHSRAREFVLGGFTRHVLHNETLPVFLFH